MRRADAAGVLAVALLLSTPACRPTGEARAPRNLVLITLDTTRADRLGCYGSKTVRTPNLDGIAAGGTVFDRAFTTAPITGPAHTSILSGTFPPFHQVRDNDIYRVPKDLPWLPSILKQHRFRTAAMVAAFPLRSGVGFSRGFDYFGDHLEAPPGSLAVTAVHTVGVASRRGDRISQEFRLWLEKNHGQEPFFVWLHYFDPHFPYEPPEGYGDLHTTQPYDGEVAYVDDCVGKVLRTLAERGLAERTALVAVADHGEGLMDHGEQTHALLLYNSTLRVPLIVRLPWLQAQRPRVKTFVSTADVMPTILEALGVAAAGAGARVQARSLLPLLSPTADPADVASYSRRPLYFETLYPFHHYGWSPLSGYILEGRKYIHGPADELYELESDMDEKRDRAGSEEAASLAARFPSLRAELEQGRPTRNLNEPTREEIAKLRSLGYLAGSVPAEEGPFGVVSKLPSPKDNLEGFFRHNEILSLALSGLVKEALEQARAQAAADPKNKNARLLVARFCAQLGFLEAADRTWAELVRDFSDKDILFSAGSYFLARRDPVRARACLDRLVVVDPGDPEVLARLADVAAAEGDHPRARGVYEVALQIDPDYKEALLGLAVSLDRSGEPGAEERFAAVAAAYPFDPQVAHDYGVYLVRHGRSAEALEHLRRAAAFSDGSLWLASHFALAAWYRQNGQPDRARESLREIELRTSSAEALAKARRILAELGGE